MKQYIDAFNKYMEEQEIGEGESLLDLLYYCFCIHNDLDTEEIRRIFQEMEGVLKKLSFDDNDTLFNMVCALCEKYQREAFRTGLLAGFHLCGELTP